MLNMHTSKSNFTLIFFPGFVPGDSGAVSEEHIQK